MHDDILSRTSIVDVYEWATGNPARNLATFGNGSRLVRCPNLGHPIKRGNTRDAHPSCSLNHDLNTWRCFSCHAKGGILKLIIAAGKAANNTEAVTWLKTGERTPLTQAVSLPRRRSGVNHPLRNELDVATYNYADEQGDLLFQVLRREGYDDHGLWSKRFLQRRPFEGMWIWHIGARCDRAKHPKCPCHSSPLARRGARNVPYRLPELLAARDARATLFLVEGEKCVEALRAMELVATTFAGGVEGAARNFKPESQALFDGVANIVDIADCDIAGRRAQEWRATHLSQRVTGRYVCVDLDRTRDDGYDIYDWRDEQQRAGKSRDDLIRALHDLVARGHVMLGPTP